MNPACATEPDSDQARAIPEMEDKMASGTAAKPKIGFIGLGIMGRPMSKNLLKAGYELVVYDIVPAGVEDVAKAGARSTGSNKEVAEASDVVITMLPDSPDVEAAYLGPGGVFEGLHSGLTLIDMSSISPVTARKVAAMAAEKGVEMLDAPVSGGDVGAINATLSIMVGGKQAVFERCKPIFEVLGKNINLVGESGAGQVCKAANQIVVALTIDAVAEALVFAQKAGVDPARVRQALMGGFAQSRILEVHGQRMLDRNFSPGFRVRFHIKDLNIALSTGREYGASLPGTALAMEILKSLEATGHGNDDHSSIARYIEANSGTEVHPGTPQK
jgi:2-hydroxy-3-oxopropionate reductase